MAESVIKNKGTLKVRSRYDVLVPSAIAPSNMVIINSSISYMANDICFCRTSTDVGHQCTPFINSNGKWSCQLYCSGQTQIGSTTRVFFQVINEA